MKGGTGASAEGFFAERAAIAVFLSTVDRDIALALLPSCRTGQVGAPYGVRIHGVSFVWSLRIVHEFACLRKGETQTTINCRPTSRLSHSTKTIIWSFLGA